MEITDCFDPWTGWLTALLPYSVYSQQQAVYYDRFNFVFTSLFYEN